MIASAHSPRIKGRVRWRFGVCLTLMIIAALLPCWWLTKSARFSNVMLSEHAYCKVLLPLAFRELYLGLLP